MPLLKQISVKEVQVLVWEITEELDFFSKKVLLNREEVLEYGQIRMANRKLEWMAARYVQRLLVRDSLVKDNFGKPHLKESKGGISISHCKGFAAAIYSECKEVGIDIEPINEKVLRIADKFLSQEEQRLLSAPNTVENYIAAWCAKEAVYKWFGKKKLNFKEDMKIRSLSLKDKKSELEFSKEASTKETEISVEKLSTIILSYL